MKNLSVKFQKVIYLIAVSVFVFSFAAFLHQSQASSGSPPSEQETVRLFSFVDESRQTNSDKYDLREKRLSIAAVRQQEIKIGAEALKLNSLASDLTEKLQIPLFDGEIQTAIQSAKDGLVRYQSDEFTWRGKISAKNHGEDWSGDVTLTFKGDAVSGLIYAPSGVYEIIPQENFRHVLTQLDQSLFPECGGSIKVKTEQKPAEKVDFIKQLENQRQPFEALFEDSSTSKTIQNLAPQSPQADDGSQIDVMVVYSDDVRVALGGTTQAQAFAQQAIAITNTAYQNSNITPRVRLVYSREIAYDETPGTLNAALNWITGNATVAADRNTYKADLVAFIVETANDSCGLAWQMTTVNTNFAPNAFSSTGRSCTVGNISFPHELGHNQGADHNPEDGSAASSLAYPYAFGHYINGSFRTVMAYANQCTGGCARVAYFSNPSVIYNGFATGITNQRDNARVLNNTAFTVANFRDLSTVNCSSSLSPGSATINNFGGTNSFTVFRNIACQGWTAIPTVSWITVTSGSPGSGSSGTIVYSVSENTGTSSRTGTISVSGGATFTVTQDGVSCNTTLNPASATVNNFGGSNSFTVSRNAACPGWSAIPTVSWITLTSGASGNGNGTVTYSVAENTGTSQRVGTISVSGAASPFTVTQDPVSCNSYLSQSGTSVASAAGSGSFSVTRAAACPSWTAIPTVSWITVTSGGSGTSGNGTVNFSVTENTSSNARTGTISVSGSSTPFTITQAALSCGYSIAPTGLNVGSAGTNGSTGVTVQNGCGWTASSNANWITITSGASGNGNGTVSFSVAANGSTNSRTGTMTIAGLVYTVTQDGAIVCSYSISPIYYFFNDAGGTTNVSVTAPAGCPWTANTSYNWLSIPSGASGSGNGTVAVSALPNPFASFRQAVVTIAGNDFSIGQTAAQSFSVTGTVSYGTTPVNQTTKFVQNAMLTVSGASVSPAMTGADGAFGFNLTPNGQYTVTPSKSGEIKGSISSFDATLILRCVAAGNGCAFTSNQRIAGDANNDNQISSFDATQILRFVAANSQNANTGQVGNWKFTPAAIDYLPLDSSKTNQNFEAILVGEVSGDWTAL